MISIEEKIKALNEVINKCAESSSAHENDYLFNIFISIRNDYKRSEISSIEPPSFEESQGEVKHDFQEVALLG